MRKMELTFEKLARFDRLREPAGLAVPLPTGMLYDGSQLAILDQEKPVPVQSRVTARWPDGSVKWLYVDFLADLPGNAAKDFTITLEPTGPVQAGPVVKLLEEAQELVIDTGCLRVALNQPGEPGIFGKVSGTGFHFEKGCLIGPILSTAGDAWEAELDSRGWQIVKSGPVVVTVQAHGTHRSRSGASLLDFEIRLSAFAGQPWLELDYRIINREKGPEVVLTGIELALKPGPEPGGTTRTALATSNYRSLMRTGTGETKLEQLIDAQYLLNDANEHFPETFYGTFWADWSGKDQGGLCLTQYQAYQNFPKSLSVDGQGLTAGILPRGNSLRLLQGVAKTHRLCLHFHSYETDLPSLNVRSLQFQLPDRPVLSPEIYKASGVFENVFVTAKLDWVERSLVELADCRVRAYGILGWGDAPDSGYTGQGRGDGLLVWTNNEYDFPHAAMLFYVKTGERRFLDYLLVAAQHLMDVDICHYSEDPLRYQGQITHSARHVTGRVSLCHEWVEGLLDFYHCTGDDRALGAALGIGENVLRLLAQPRYHGAGGINARETGWALRSLVALYRETTDPKWLEPAETIVGHFATWKETYGGWLAPYTDHTVVRVPFMIAVAVSSLMRYYRIRPQERIKQMIVEAVTDLVEHCRLENGLFYYKELPSLRRNGNNLLVLEALAYAYEFTGDRRFLEAGLPTFELVAQEQPSVGQSKQQIEDVVLVMGGNSPKRFAQSFYTIVYYYRVAVEAGLLSS